MMSRFSADRRWPLCLVLILLLPALGGWELLRRRSASIDAGNGHMKAGKPEEALAEYDKAIAELPADPGAHFDRGTALSALSRFDEAAQEFLRATEAKDTPLRSEAFYNLGNAFFKKDKFKEAFAAYRRALELDPRNERAKWNSEIALKKQREDDKKKQDQKDKDKDNKKDDKKDDKKDENNKDKKDDEKKDKKDENNKDKKEEPKDPKKDEDKKDEGKDPKPNDEKKADEPSPPKPEDKPPAEKSVEQQEMESALDGLDKSPKELEKQRALLRAVRRAPPTRDW